jgi:ABC-type Zn uptake system ZnuABC Zn-binding protein ZnuA
MAMRVLTLIAFVLLSLCAEAADKLKVVTSIPDLADIARRIGGERVEVQSICKGLENPHFVSIKPSHLVAMSRADVFVQVGLSLEVAFVPGLLENCGNPRIQPGRPGFINASLGFAALDVPGAVDRKLGDVHPQGNPHLNLSVEGGESMARNILAGLCAVDPAHKADYEARHAVWTKEYEAAKLRWKKQAESWKGRKVCVYHQEFTYLIRAYELNQIGSIEPKPGIPPTPSTLAELIRALRKETDVCLLAAAWARRSALEEVRDQAGVTLVELPNMCHGLPGTESWIGMMDLLHKRLAEAFGQRKGS